MATGHVLPSQKEAVSNLHRAQAQLTAQPPPAVKPSFIPENNNRRWLLTQAPVDSERLEAIRRQARQLWGDVGAGVGVGVETAAPPAAGLQSTSYQRHYSTKRLDEPTLLRPTSPNRRNNPHPPLVFLTCRLHNVPGFSNADSATDKETYKVDASHGPAEQDARLHYRAKFANRPDDAALRQYADKDPVEEVFGQKLEFRVSTLGRLMDAEGDEDFVEARKRMTDWQQTARPSLHRYLKFQGPVERDRLKVRSAGTTPQQLDASQLQSVRWQQHQPLRQQQRRCATTSVSRSQQTRLVYQPTRARGDYLIHPMWPPTLPHHRVP